MNEDPQSETFDLFQAVVQHWRPYRRHIRFLYIPSYAIVLIGLTVSWFWPAALFYSTLFYGLGTGAVVALTVVSDLSCSANTRFLNLMNKLLDELKKEQEAMKSS